MIFSTASSVPRPVRLPEALRQWAWDSMHGKYGDEAVRYDSISLDHIPDFESMSPIRKYDAAIMEIAKDAPLRICPEEQICGSATLGMAIHHAIPATHQGKPVFSSVSHLTIRYDKVIKEGLGAYESEIQQRIEDPSLTAGQKEFLESLLNVIEAIRIWHQRYLLETEQSRPDLHRLLQQVPFSPARNFHEALQSLWFTFAFVRLCGNWPGIGRLDWLLGDYLRQDLQSGVLDLDQARELMASFFIKGCEWIQSDTAPGSGDAQHYQNIILAGVDIHGKELCNEVTFLALDIVEELGISDYPITIRLNRNSPRVLKDRAAQVMRHGGGVVAIYNEDLILQSLEQLGYSVEEARQFANDGCWEVQIPGKTNFSYMPFDSLQIFNKAIGLQEESVKEFSSVEEIYQAFHNKLEQTVDALFQQRVVSAYKQSEIGWISANPVTPCSVVSLFEENCIASAKSYYDCGTTYLVRSPHIGGAPDVANSLYAIEKLVFEEKKVSFPQLIQHLKNNWEDDELLRLFVKNSYVYYGNDNDDADRWHSRILNDFADMVISCNKKAVTPVKFIPGVSTFGRQIEWLPNRCATAFGYRKGDILSGNDSPVPGTDLNGATSIIKSYCKSDLGKQSCGAALDIRLFPNALNSDSGLNSLIALIDGFLALGGFFLQMDAIDTQTLREAQADPQKYKTLSVRVSGWNARFVTLNREWQNMIIERSSQNF